MESPVSNSTRYNRYVKNWEEWGINEYKNAKFSVKVGITTYAMNECMFDVVKAEIIKGFNEEQQQEMLEAVKQLRTYTYKFSEIYFNANKYCYGRCGTMASLFPIADEGIMMRDLLAKLLFLNWHKGGY